MNSPSVSAFRLKLVVAIIAILFAILFLRLWQIQILQGDKFLTLSEENRIRLVRVKAPRGLLLDTNGQVLVKNRPSFNVFIIPEDAKNLDLTAKHVAELLPIPENEIITKVKKSQRPKFEPVLIQRDILYYPLQNRAIQGTYAPGSIFKLITGAAGLEKGLVNQSSTIFCGGSIKIGSTRKRDSKYEGHGNVTIVDALEQSCNVYLYKVGGDVGISALAKYAMSFGLGRPTGVDLPNEEAGLIPTGRVETKDLRGQVVSLGDV